MHPRKKKISSEKQEREMKMSGWLGSRKTGEEERGGSEGGTQEPLKMKASSGRESIAWI